MNSNNSLNNVKRIFESKTGAKLNAKRSAYHSAKTSVALVALIACCLTISAFAISYLSDGEIVKFFQRGTLGIQDEKNELSGAQLMAVEGYTTYMNESVESNGTILTIKSVTASISSGNLVAYFVIEMEVPDGVLDNIHDLDLTFEHSGLRFERYSSGSDGGSIELVLDDESGRENVKTIVYAYYGDGLDFGNRTTPLTLVLTNLSSWPDISREEMAADPKPLFEYLDVVAEGEWSFDLDSAVFKESIDLIDEPVLFLKYGYTMKTLQISPLCLYISLDYPELEYLEDERIEAPLAFWNDTQIIMRDGSVVKADAFDRYGRCVGSENKNMMALGGAAIGETSLITSFYFNVPLDLEEADYVLFADGTRIDIP